MRNANQRWRQYHLVKNWLLDRIDNHGTPPQARGVDFYEAMLIVCTRAIARLAGNKRAHAVLDLASYELVGGTKVERHG